MEERLRIVLYLLGGAVVAALIGMVFGGVAGALAWASGKSAGGAVGLRARLALSQLLSREFSRPWSGAIVGAADGGSALAVVGGLAGFWSGYTDHAEVLGYLAVGALALGTSAALCGAVAYCLVWAKSAAIYAIVGLLGGLFLGALAEGRLAIAGGSMVGTLAGGALGITVTILVRLRLR